MEHSNPGGIGGGPGLNGDGNGGWNGVCTVGEQTRGPLEGPVDRKDGKLPGWMHRGPPRSRNRGDEEMREERADTDEG